MKKQTHTRRRLMSSLIASAALLSAPALLAQAAPPPPKLPSLPPVPGAGAPRELPRIKALKTTTGMDPAQPDFGAEADMVSAVGTKSPALPPKRWNRKMHGFFRVPALASQGPRNDGFEGSELHAPVRVPGAPDTDWNHVGLTPLPHASLYMMAENRNVKGTLILSADTFYDSGFTKLNKMGGVAQAYVTLSWPAMFGNKGGLAWTVGSFSNRYGNAGPNQQSRGFYGTSLFGSTHVGGYALTANYDITPDLELVIEQGAGAKLEVVPWENGASQASYLPDQGPVPQGSNFLHHVHASLIFNNVFTVAGHHMLSFSPNDRGATGGGERSEEASITVYGGELRMDHPTFGNAYLGYSHVEAVDVLPLSNALEVLHSENGYGLTANYFPAVGYSGITNDLGIIPDPGQPAGRVIYEDSGSIDSILGQYMIRFGPFFNAEKKDLVWSVFGMLNSVSTPTGFEDTKMKFGTELQVAPFKHFSFGLRYDFVDPGSVVRNQVPAEGEVLDYDAGSGDAAYQVISPRLVVQSEFLSREYIIVSYSRYLLGDETRPSAPFFHLEEPDPDLFAITAVVSF